ncbi:hypothetical protein PVK06_004984 [Gossypium arboreum]|uniref:Uncharacterized protein n=1 Tax=Gossypium arboreum TaxID=29729 RepID=A0ABR0QTF4_GOSAR|nr:hypothetical protein PVK06_004984 [Gossypium arboreum]
MGMEIEVNKGAEMLRIALEYLLELFTTSNAGNDARILGLVQRKITDSMNDELLQSFTKEKIWAAVKAMSPLRAPRIV